MPSQKFSDLAAEQLAFYVDHPVAFVEDQILRIWDLTAEQRASGKPGTRVEPEQKEILEAVANNRLVTVRSGHGIGKTAAIDFCIIWFIYTRKDAKIILTGSKFDQLKITTWAELGKWIQRSRLQDQLAYTAERLYHVSSPLTWFTQIVTAAESENITGAHGEHVLIVGDEASAESIDKIQDGLMGCLTFPDNHILLCGNPTRTQGFFFDTHTKNDGLWYRLHFDSEKSALVTPDFINYWKKRCHPDSDMYRVRIKGEFPRGNAKAIIQFSDCEAARVRSVVPGEPIEIGVDPAFEGDDLAVIATRRGMYVEPLRTFPKTKPTELLMHTLQAVRAVRVSTGYRGKIRVKVDVGGGYGTALVEGLSLNQTDNIEVVPIHSNAKSTIAEYRNYGTQMWFEMSSIIQDVQLPDDDFLVEDLSGREWNPANLNVVQMETKADFKKRLQRSPDRADAVILAFADGPRKVFQKDTYDVTTVKAFSVDWFQTRVMDPAYDGPMMLDIRHYVALVLTKDLMLYGIAAIYEVYADRLWIYQEYFQDSPAPDVMSRQIIYKSMAKKFDDGRRPRIIGNDLMFRQDGDRRPLSEVFRTDGGLFVAEPNRYDEFGAIGLGSMMFREDKIIIHSEAQEARSKMNLWSIKANRVEEEGYGFCKCLLLILSEVKQQRRAAPALPKIHDYQAVKVKDDNAVGSLTAWMRR